MTAPTILDSVDIGSVVWSSANNSRGEAAWGGVAVDVGLAHDGEPYVIVLVSNPEEILTCARRRGVTSGRMTTHDGVIRRRVFADDLGSTEEPRSWAKMTGAATKAVRAAAELKGERRWELIEDARRLEDEANNLTKSDKAPWWEQEAA